MKKTLLFALLACFGWLSVAAQSIVLQESFEKGFPSDWTQESVSGDQLWTVETADLTYPASAANGKARIALRNTSGETKGYKTRLITPVMRLDTVFQPILRYYHAQVKWTADFDTLRVLYRIAPDQPWHTLQEFTQPVQNWTKELIDLPTPSTTYQLAFEGSENMGRGIVLDSIMVRSKPDCTVPHDMAISNILDSEATLSWQASYDAEEFNIILAKSDEVFDIDDVDLEAAKASGLVVDELTVPDFLRYTRLSGLEPKTNYVAFVRSVCESETSDWGVFQFYMKAVVNVPYAEDFDLPASNAGGHNGDWSYGNSMFNDNPWINSHTQADNPLYVRSGTALCFTGTNTLGSTAANLPAGDWAYAAAPAANVASMSNLQVRFWASLGGYGMYRTMARAIIIGVMTDPEDIATFVPVDTMHLWRYGTFEEHITTFEKYTGEGRNIAFVSRFDKPNQFFIDDMRIEQIPAIGKVMNVEVAPDAKAVSLAWRAVQGGDRYNIIVADTLVEAAGVDTLQAEHRIISASVNATQWTSEDALAQLTDYYAYIQAEGGEWSNGVAFTTSYKLTLPVNIGFEDTEVQLTDGKEAWQWYTTATNTRPSTLIGSTSSYKRSGAKYMTYSMASGLDAWLVLPVVDNVLETEIEFWMRAYGTTYSNTQITVGVMTDPQDLTTFVAVASFDNATATYKRCYTDFLSYTGTGRYIALRWTEAKGTGNVYPILDDIQIRTLGEAIMPRLMFDEVDDKTVTFSWDAPGMNLFQILIMTDAGLENDALTSAYNDASTKNRVYATEISDATTYTVPDGVLRWGRTYYAYVRSYRQDKNAYSYWSQSLGFTLDTIYTIPLPYTETFDYWGVGSGTMAPAWVVVSPETYPYLYASSNHTTGGAAGVYLRSNTTALTGKLFAPQLDVDDLSKVKLSFWAKKNDSVTGADTLSVGVATAADETAVITWMDTVVLSATTFEKVETVFADWTPEAGNRIVFANTRNSTGTNNSKYLSIDDVTFESTQNVAPFKFKTLSITDSEAEITWQGDSENGWKLVVSKVEIDPDTITEVKPANVLIADSLITSKPLRLTDLTAQTSYYIYLKSVDGTSWSDGYVIFTECLPINLRTNSYYKIDFEGLTTASKSSYDATIFPECWERHWANEINGTTSGAPYIYSTTSTSTNVYNGKASIYLKANYSECPAWFVTPRIEANNMANINIVFWARGNDSSLGEMYVGVMTDPADYSTFTRLYTYKPTASSVWNQVDCMLSDYQPEMGQYIAFATPADLVSGVASAFYIDDIEIIEVTCPKPNPVLSRVTNSSVVLMYSADAMRARILLSKDEISQDKLNDDTNGQYLASVIGSDSLVQDIDTTNVGLRLENLDGDTNYYIAVQHVCDDNERSPWKVVSFRTLCNPMSLDEAELIDFEDMTALAMANTADHSIPCWTVGNKYSTTSTYIPYVAQSDYYYNKGKFLYIRSSVSTSASSNAPAAYAIMPAIDVDDIRNVQISFIGQALNGTTSTTTTFPASREAASTITSTYAGGIIVGVVTDPYDLSTFVGVDTILKTDNWRYNEIVRFDKYKGDMNEEFGKYIGFMAEFDKTDMYVVDDISITAIPACAEPLKIRVVDIDETEATVTWDGLNTAYRVMVTTEKMNDNSQWEKHAAYVINDTVTFDNAQTALYEHHLTGLNGLTNYYVYIKTLCEGEDGVWCLDYVPFKTTCPATLAVPFVENFDDYASASTKSIPNCWTTFYNGLMNEEASYPSVYTTAKYGTTGNGLYWVYSSTYQTEDKRPTAATLPVAGNIGDVTVSFMMKTTNSTGTPNGIMVGYASDVSSLERLLETVHYVDTVYAPKSSTNWEEYNIIMSGEGENMHIVLSELYVTTYAVYIDDFKVVKTPSCYMPDAVTVDNIATDAVHVSFTPHFATDNRWNVRAVSADQQHTVDTAVTDTSFVFLGLHHSTTYNLYVQNDCGDDDLSEWTEPVNFTTLYIIGDGTFYGFEEEEGAVQSEIANSTTEALVHPSLHTYYTGVTSIGSGYVPRQIKGEATARTGERAMYLQMYNYTGCPAYFSLPEIAGIDTLQLRFDMRATNTAKGSSITDSNTWPDVPLCIGVIDQDYNLDSYRTIYAYKSSMYDPNNGDDTYDVVSEQNNRLFDQVVVPLTADMAGKYVVFMDSTPVANSLYIDNLRLEKKQGFRTPIIGKSVITPTSLTLTWDTEGVGDKWNVYLCSTPAAFPLDSAKENDIAFKQLNLTEPTVTFTTLTPNTKYYAYLQIADAEGLAATSARRIYLTPKEEKLSADTVINFEDGLVQRYPNVSAGTGDTLYYMVKDWYTGNDVSSVRLHQPWARINDYSATAVTKSAGVVVSRSGKRALQLMTLAHSAVGAYAAMPEIDADYDTLQINFYGRTYHLTSSGNVGSIGSLNMPLVVGTMTDPNNPATFVALDTVYYNNDMGLTTTTAASSLTDQGWQRFSVRLTGAAGRYIAFSSPTVEGTIALQPWYIDDISFSGHTCITPQRVQVRDVTAHEALLTWNVADKGAMAHLQVSKSMYFNNDMIADTLTTATSLLLKGLEGTTTYYVRVRQACGEFTDETTADWTDWSARNSFFTECALVEEGYIQNFDDEASHTFVPGTSSGDRLNQLCWTVGVSYPDVYTGSVSYLTYPYIRKNPDSGSSQVALSGAYAWQLNGNWTPNQITSSNGSNYYDKWIAMPIWNEDEDPEELQLTFYALPGMYSKTTNKITTTYTGTTNLPAVIVGVMTDPNDYSTFVTLDTCRYAQTLSTAMDATEANNYQFQRFSVPLKGMKELEGRYLAFRTFDKEYIEAHPEYTSSTLSTTIFIDNVSIEPLNECYVPQRQTVSDITLTSAKLIWEGDEDAVKWIVTVYGDATLSKVITVDTVDVMYDIVNKLDTNTVYYWTVQQVCDYSSSPVSGAAQFRTLRTPVYNEYFNSSIVDGWTVYNGSAQEVFDEISSPVLYANGSAGITSQLNWCFNNSGYGMESPHVSCRLNSETGSSPNGVFVRNYKWLVSPAIVLDEEHDAWLTFNAALTYFGSAAAPDLNGDDDQFMVIISDDGGKTWKRENAVVWNNETSNDPEAEGYIFGKGDYVLNSLPAFVNNGDDPLFVDLSAYKGKTIAVAFYAESSVRNAFNQLHIDNVHFGYYKQVLENVEACQFEDIYSAAGGFSVNGDEAAVGSTVLNKTQLSALPADGKLLPIDTLYTLVATYLEAPHNEINVTICEGEEYGEQYGFEPRGVSGVYKRKSTSLVTGCDSITTLNLTVLPRLYSEEVVDLCSGKSYEFNGVSYSKTGVYVDTLQSLISGCDSITTLILTVAPAVRHEYDVRICAGTSYYFTEKYPELTASGTYTDSVKTVEGCDSIVILNLTVEEQMVTEFNAKICEGETYYFTANYPALSATGTYIDTLQAVGGCDSVVIVNLSVESAVVREYSDVLCQGGSYWFTPSYPALTQSGTYTDILKTEAGCDSIVTLHLEVNTDTVRVDVTIGQNELPYFYPNTSITYPLGTETGIYRDTVLVSGEGECDYVLIHNLTIVESETSVDRVGYSELVLVPNMVKAGQTVEAQGDFGKDPLTVEVYDMTGRCMLRQQMTASPVLTIGGFDVAGVYTVRITDEQRSRLFVGRVIVY